MRQHVRTLGVCLLAAFAIAALAAASASAQRALGAPEWGKCEATPGSTGGKYGNAGCTGIVKSYHGQLLGGYEWYPLAQTPTEIEEDQSTSIQYTDGNYFTGILQPVSETTFTFAGGQKIQCGALEPETEIRLGSAHSTTEAPKFAFGGCFNEANDEECHSTDAHEPAEITTDEAWVAGYEHTEGSWTGTTSFIHGKKDATPEVGIVYQTEEQPSRFWQQIVCESENGGEPLSITIGGHETGEQLITQITPVNTMSGSFEATLRQSGGVELPAKLERRRTKPLLAQVNDGEWGPVGVETTMLFPEVVVGFAQHNRRGLQLELKATP